MREPQGDNGDPRGSVGGLRERDGTASALSGAVDAFPGITQEVTQDSRCTPLSRKYIAIWFNIEPDFAGTVRNRIGGDLKAHRIGGGVRNGQVVLDRQTQGGAFLRQD